HRVGMLLAISAGFMSAVCIIISGPVWTSGWPEWWNWWLELPIWPDPGPVHSSTYMETYGANAPVLVGGTD
ncbi:MAG: photosynthetic reaction center subunit L, partial [Roseicyclus sp.]